MGFDSLMVSMLLDWVASVSKRVRRESWDKSEKEECKEKFYTTAVLNAVIERNTIGPVGHLYVMQCTLDPFINTCIVALVVTL